MNTTLLAIATVIAAPVLFAQQPGPVPPLVSTTGSAQIRVVPDLVDLYFEVEVRNADLAVARKQQAERAAKVLAALRAAGVAEPELQSSQVEIAPDYTDRRREQTEKVMFYRVSQKFSCTLHEVKKVPDVTSEAVLAGATSVGEAELRTSQLRKYRDEARVRAIQAAKEKATALATALGAKVGKPYTIKEEESPNYGSGVQNTTLRVPLADDAGAGEEAKATFAPGMIHINASVSVSFLLE